MRHRDNTGYYVTIAMLVAGLCMYPGPLMFCLAMAIPFFAVLAVS